MKKPFLLLLLLCAVCTSAVAQVVTGRVEDAQTGEPLELVRIHYADNTRKLWTTDSLGRFRIPLRKGRLVFNYMGYDKQEVNVGRRTRLEVKMSWSDQQLNEVEVVAKKIKYRRKENPAVELMRRVIAAKEQTALRSRPYYSFRKYEKMTASLDHVSEKMLEEEKLKKLPWLKDQIERHPETGDLVLPLTVEEKVSRYLYRHEPETEKVIVEGQRGEGITDVLNTGEIVTTLLADVFQDVDLFADDIRLFQYPFTSPIASGESAIRFYRYFILDTVQVDLDSCYHVRFMPNNPQDFGFSGSLYILKDSTWRVRRAQLNVPVVSGVNFVDKLNIELDFATLPGGEQVVTNSNMRVHMELTSWIQRLMVQRVATYSDYSFEPIADKAFKGGAKERKEALAEQRPDDYWAEQRPVPLTQKEQDIGKMMRRMVNSRGAKPILWIARAFIENYVETSMDPDKPNKFDIGQVNTVVGTNFVEGFRLRLGGQTTANLNPHWFLRGYAKYGFKDEKWKGLAQLTYSFNKKEYSTHEFPMRNITASYQKDVTSPSDKFLNTDADNVFVAWKWTSVRHMNYFERFNVRLDWEWENGMSLNANLRREKDTGAGDLFYQRLANGMADSDGQWVPTNEATAMQRHLTFSELTIGVQYKPGVTYVSTKQRRLQANHDAPVFGLSHTIGLKNVLGGQYNYNYTEATIYKRFWFNSWGKMDWMLKGGVQWNRVPYPFLCMPQANLSYFTQDYTFSLVNNMEFLNDRFASAMMQWDLNGKIFNRIPLLKRLKWRELIGVNVLWGMLTDKNNPFLAENQGSQTLMFFPGSFNAEGTFTSQSRVMDRKKPYVEVVVGIHNIFKVLRFEYVRRLNYVSDGETRWGIRGCIQMSF